MTIDSIPVYEVIVQTLSNGQMKVLTLEAGSHHIPGLHGTRGYYEKDEPVGYINMESKS